VCSHEFFSFIDVVVAAKVISTTIVVVIFILDFHVGFDFAAFSGSIGAHDDSRTLFSKYVEAMLYWS
jgi:hypothetical protein